MQHGTIKAYLSDRGFGFIARGDLPDLFFHVSQWGLAEHPLVGDTVQFEEGDSQRGPVALRVHRTRR